MHSAVNAALRHPCHKVEVFIVLVFNCFATPQRLFPQGDKVSTQRLLFTNILILFNPHNNFLKFSLPVVRFLLHLLTHRRIFKNLTPYISTPSIILPPIRMFPRRRGEQSMRSMCRECAERAERVQRVRRECAGSVSATGRRPIDGFGGNDMTISGLRRGPKEISKMKIPETAEAESEDTGKTEGGGTKKRQGTASGSLSFFRRRR